MQAVTYACVDNVLYYLVMASGSERDCVNQGGAAVSCTFSPLMMVPGVDSLDGKNWGGLLRDDLIAGSVLFFQYPRNMKCANVDRISEPLRHSKPTVTRTAASSWISVRMRHYPMSMIMGCALLASSIFPCARPRRLMIIGQRTRRETFIPAVPESRNRECRYHVKCCLGR